MMEIQGFLGRREEKTYAATWASGGREQHESSHYSATTLLLATTQHRGED